MKMSSRSYLKSVDFRAGEGLFSIRISLMDGIKSKTYGTFHPLSKVLQLPDQQIGFIRYLEFKGPENRASWVLSVEFLNSLGDTLGILGSSRAEGEWKTV